MDHALTVQGNIDLNEPVEILVLILVVMDHALTDYHLDHIVYTTNLVLILVVMDHALTENIK